MAVGLPGREGPTQGGWPRVEPRLSRRGNSCGIAHTAASDFARLGLALRACASLTAGLCGVVTLPKCCWVGRLGGCPTAASPQGGSELG